MIRCFWQSRIAVLIILAATAVTGVLAMRRGMPLPVQLISLILITGIGVCLALFLGNMVASQVNNHLLGILHIDLDPVLFVEKYKNVPSLISARGAERAITSSYLADGYAAMGEFDMAIAVMSNDPTDKKGHVILSLQCLYHNNLCNYYLQKGDLKNGEREFDELLTCIKKASAENPALAENMKITARLFRNWIYYYKNEPVSVEALLTDAEKTQFQIRRIETLYLLALTYIREGQKGNALIQLNLIIENGGKLFLRERALLLKAALL